MILASLIGKALAARLAPFLPAIGRIAAVLSLAAALVFAWRWHCAALIEEGRELERAEWVKKDLETKLANETTRADRLQGALAITAKNVATNTNLIELRDEFLAAFRARERQLAQIQEVQLETLFERGPDPCRVYVRDPLIILHNAAGTDALPP